jgi:hypothetical protein
LEHTHDINENNIISNSSKIVSGSNNNDLISVSDDTEAEEEDEDEEEMEDEEGEEEEYEEDEENEEEEVDEIDDNFSFQSEEDLEIKDSKDQMKLLNLTLTNEDIENDSPIEDLKIGFEEPIPIQNDKIKTVHLDNPIHFEESELNHSTENGVKTKTTIDNFNNVLKNISISDLGDGVEDSHTAKSDYKKMSLNKLREVVVNKGFLPDASKLKKNEILKMLGEE